MLCVPLKYKEKVFGVVNLESKANGQPFDKSDDRVLSILAKGVAAAITNVKLYELAITDGLTKLGIHRYFQIRLDQELNRARRYNLNLSLAMFDIDYFKKFNDTYGHPEGDKVLIQVAQLMKESTRDSDLCARYGGEEFVMILTDSSHKDAVMIADRFRKKVENSPLSINNNTVNITVSGGVASYDGNKRLTKQDLIERADQALYCAKKQGRNRITDWNSLAQMEKISQE